MRTNSHALHTHTQFALQLAACSAPCPPLSATSLHTAAPVSCGPPGPAACARHQSCVGASLRVCTTRRRWDHVQRARHCGYDANSSVRHSHPIHQATSPPHCTLRGPPPCTSFILSDPSLPLPPYPASLPSAKPAMSSFTHSVLPCEVYTLWHVLASASVATRSPDNQNG
jgi:hypothetical protein